MDARVAVKKDVSETKARVLDDAYKKLDTKEGEKEMYKLAKARERRTRDVVQVKCIKGEEGQVLVSDEQIVERWRRYFSQLYNDTGGLRGTVGWFGGFRAALQLFLPSAHQQKRSTRGIEEDGKEQSGWARRYTYRSLEVPRGLGYRLAD